MLPQQQIYNFLRTTTVKFSPLADYLNATLIQKGFEVNDQDPASWKYYLNMVGRYHVSDTPMVVMSVDTHQQIVFSPETLKNHPRTKAAYVPGGPFYNRLCDTYPDQVDLIKSILFPVESLEKAMMAEDLTLLKYGHGYLEEYEESVLIMKVEAFLEIMKERWYFDFLDDEPFFHITFWASLPIHLASLLMTARLEHVHTPYVHSFELWSTLKAEGLDDYSDILSREKAMMLYQNIKYFRNNAGKQSNLDILTTRLLSDLGIGIYGRIVVQQSEKRAEDYQLTPQLVPIRLPVVSEALPAPIEIKSVSTVQSEILEKGLTDSNSAEMVTTIERKLGDTRLNEFATKFLEIRPVAQNKPYVELLNGFLMETLTVSIMEGYYSKAIEVRDPLTNELIFLNPKELLALYNYAVYKSMGLEPEDFPRSVLLRHAFNTTIGKPAAKIPYYNGELYVKMAVEPTEYLSGLDYDRDIQSPAEFTEQATRLWLRYMTHYLADQGTKIDSVRTILEYLNGFCHTRREQPIDLITGYTNYAEWLGPTGINLQNNIIPQYDLQTDPRKQWGNLADTIISTLIPINDTLRRFGNFTLSNSGFERLRQLFVQMCSYRVVFLQSDRETSEHLVAGKWSTYYGPDHMDTFSDFIVTTNMDVNHKVNLRKDLTLLSGVTEHLATKVSSPAGYSVTTTVVDQHNHAVLKSEHLRATSTTIGVSEAQGTLHLARTPIMAQGIFPAS
jgi:hypothetical protein